MHFLFGRGFSSTETHPRTFHTKTDIFFKQQLGTTNHCDPLGIPDLITDLPVRGPVFHDSTMHLSSWYDYYINQRHSFDTKTYQEPTPSTFLPRYNWTSKHPTPEVI